MGSVLGTILDPAADKMLMTTLVVTLAVKDLIPGMHHLHPVLSGYSPPTRVCQSPLLPSSSDATYSSASPRFTSATRLCPHP